MDLTERFLRGLADYNLTVEEIRSGKWRYCGGNQGRHYRYFKNFFNNVELPEQEYNCVCGHHIQENCYITNDEDLLVLGNCCIKRFLPNETSCRTCQICKKPHKNRKDNLCHNCRKKREIRYYHMGKILKKYIKPQLLWFNLVHNISCEFEEIDFTISRTFDTDIVADTINEYPCNLTLDDIVIKAIENNANIIVKTDKNIWRLKYKDKNNNELEKELCYNEKKNIKSRFKTFLYTIIY